MPSATHHHFSGKQTHHKVHRQPDATGNVCRFYVVNTGLSAIGPRTWVAYQLLSGQHPLALVSRATRHETVDAAREYLAGKSHPYPSNLAL